MPFQVVILMSEWMGAVEASEKNSGSRYHKVRVAKSGLELGAASPALALHDTHNGK